MWEADDTVLSVGRGGSVLEQTIGVGKLALVVATEESVSCQVVVSEEDVNIQVSPGGSRF